ncbi:MAG TPA: SET domain-containing protein-lysine N-methyltransferase [Myxococcales bacterium]|nr:SET domain-containing protein-lysine N-methyltransferase [Myxococcales bacterium]
MHWLHPDLALRDTSFGKGIFAQSFIPKETLLCVWGGRVYTTEGLDAISEELRTHAIQVEVGAFLVPELPLHDADYFNHNCQPNAGFSSSITLVAMRDINADEHVCFDYAMSDTVPYDEFGRDCGARLCRKKVTAEDWRREDLQRRYQGFFSPYVQRLIEKHLLVI